MKLWILVNTVVPTPGLIVPTLSAVIVHAELKSGPVTVLVPPFPPIPPDVRAFAVNVISLLANQILMILFSMGHFNSQEQRGSMEGVDRTPSQLLT